MYRLAENTEEIYNARKIYSSYMKELESLLKEEYVISSQISLVGSAKRNLITFNGRDRSIDFDYNLKIYNGMSYDPFALKNAIRSVLNEVMKNHGLRDAKDSTSALTVNIGEFNLIYHGKRCHIDLAIITEHDGHIHRLIHNKQHGQMTWNQMADISQLKRKENSLKEKHWLEVRNVYVAKKNLHIDEKEHHPSYNCYIEAVNEVYHKYFRR